MYLEKEFKRNMYVCSKKRKIIATTLGTSERRINTWFDNRRTKNRNQCKKFGIKPPTKDTYAVNCNDCKRLKTERKIKVPIDDILMPLAKKSRVSLKNNHQVLSAVPCNESDIGRQIDELVAYTIQDFDSPAQVPQLNAPPINTATTAANYQGQVTTNLPSVSAQVNLVNNDHSVLPVDSQLCHLTGDDVDAVLPEHSDVSQSLVDVDSCLDAWNLDTAWNHSAHCSNPLQNLTGFVSNFCF